MSFAGLKTNVIAAFDEERAIGKNGALPWHISEDLKRFSALTRGHAVLMGKTTWDSIPENYRPFRDRLNIVLSTTLTSLGDQAFISNSLDSLQQSIRDGDCKPPSKDLWIIGGSKVYGATMPFWDDVYITKVVGKHDGDTFFPKFEQDFDLVSEEPFEKFSFCLYRRK